MSKKVLISSCLLGENVKYDGTNNSITQNQFIKKLQKLNLIVSICPEVEGGLPTPRVPVEIQNNRAINKKGEDKTKEFKLGANKTLEIALQNDIEMAIMKSKSPSCGAGQIYDGTFLKKLINGDGISTALLKDKGIKIFGEDELEIAQEYWERLYL